MDDFETALMMQLKARKIIVIILLSLGLLLAGASVFVFSKAQETLTNIKNQVEIECPGRLFLSEAKGDPAFRKDYQEVWFCAVNGQPNFEIKKGYKNDVTK